MKSTLAMFSTINDTILNKYSLEELCFRYKTNHNPQILANVFVRLYDKICVYGTKFFYIYDDDLSSISVQQLDYSLINYDSNNKSSFTTYYMNVLYKSLYTINVHRITYDKYKVNFLTDNISLSADLYDSDGIDSSTINNNNYSFYKLWKQKSSVYDFESNVDLSTAISNSSDFSEQEKQLCFTVMNYNCKLNKVDIASMIGVSRPTLDKLIKSVAIKLHNLLDNSVYNFT